MIKKSDWEAFLKWLGDQGKRSFEFRVEAALKRLEEKVEELMVDQAQIRQDLSDLKTSLADFKVAFDKELQQLKDAIAAGQPVDPAFLQEIHDGLVEAAGNVAALKADADADDTP